MLMATPQCAIAQCVSSLEICTNSFSSSSYQNECSRATPRANGFCADAVQETGKWTVPSCVSVRSSGWGGSLSLSSSAKAANERKPDNSKHAMRFIENPTIGCDRILVTLCGRVKRVAPEGRLASTLELFHSCPPRESSCDEQPLGRIRKAQTLASCPKTSKRYPAVEQSQPAAVSNVPLTPDSATLCR